MRNFLRILDRSLSFRQLLWLIPVVLTIHNAEEALTMPGWVMANLAAVKDAIPFGIELHFSPAQLLASLIVATVVPFAVTFFCTRGDAKGKGTYLMLVLQAIVLLNVFIPHLFWTLRTLSYNPGVITACAINLPFSIYFFRRASGERIIDGRGIVRLFLLAALVYPLIAWLLHGAGDLAASAFAG